MLAQFLILALWAGGRPEPPPSAAAPDPVPFERVEEEIFARSCGIGGCHTGPDSVMGLDLRRGRAWRSIMGRPVRSLAGFDDDAWLVVPGDPDQSYLYQKIRGDHERIVGEQMPLSGPCLSEQEIELIRRWIEQGAPAPADLATRPRQRVIRLQR